MPTYTGTSSIIALFWCFEPVVHRDDTFHTLNRTKPIGAPEGWKHEKQVMPLYRHKTVVFFLEINKYAARKRGCEKFAKGALLITR